MANVKRIQEMAKGNQAYDGWRLRSLTEEQARATQVEIAQHREALTVIEAKLAKGDLAGAAALFKEMQTRIGKSIEGLR